MPPWVFIDSREWNDLLAALKRVETAVNNVSKTTTRIDKGLAVIVAKMPGPAARVTINLGTATNKGERPMATLTTDQQFANVTLEITDDKGRQAQIDGMPVWASSDETVLTVTPTENSLTATIDSVAPGSARVSVSVDADLGEGVTSIVGSTEDITVTMAPAGAATNVKLVLGEPVDKA